MVPIKSRKPEVSVKPATYTQRTSKKTWLVIVALVIAIWPNWLTSAQKRVPSRKAATPAQWYRFIGPDGDFSLAFPAKPEPFESEAEGPVTSIRQYHLSTKEGRYFSVNFQDMGGDPLSPDANEFGPMNDAMVTSAARERGEKVVQVHRLSKNVFEMEVWQAIKNTGNKLHRIDHAILRHGRLYTLACGSLIDNKEVDKAICQKFFDSIRFLK